jgi:TonB family protein
MNIHIKNPCPEKWENMAPSQEGAFCKVCNKEVIDFSGKKQADIVNYFATKGQNERVCGRMASGQLLDLNFDGFFQRFSLWNLRRKISVVIYFIFGLGLFSCSGDDKTVGDMEQVGKVALLDTVKKKNDTVYDFKHGDMGVDYKYEADSNTVKSKDKQEPQKKAEENKTVTKAGENQNQDEVHNHPPPLPLAPTYKEGKAAMEKIIYSNLKYPEKAKENKIEGTVLVMFKVTKEGKVKDLQVKNKSGYGLDEEAIRLVKLLTEWNPGKQGGKVVEMDFGVPVNFRLK